MTIGVIVFARNNTLWLEKTLWGYMAQTRPADEIIVANLCYSQETADLVCRYKAYLPLLYIRPECQDSSITQIISKAIEACNSDYLVFSDQSTIPRSDFLAAHERDSAKGYFLFSNSVKLTMDASLQIIDDDIASGLAFHKRWLYAHGVKLSIQYIKLIRSSVFAWFQNYVTIIPGNWKGLNISIWREDLLLAGSISERMQYTKEYSDLGLLLINNGIKPRSIQNKTVALRLYTNN